MNIVPTANIPKKTINKQPKIPHLNPKMVKIPRKYKINTGRIIKDIINITNFKKITSGMLNMKLNMTKNSIIIKIELRILLSRLEKIVNSKITKTNIMPIIFCTNGFIIQSPNILYFK